MTAVAAAIVDLKATFPDHDVVSTDETDLVKYSKPAYPQYPTSPFSVVVHALSTEDVVKTVNISRKHSVPIVTRGGGTGLEGSQSAPEGERGCICLNMSRMNRIIQIHEDDGDVVVEAGISWNVLNETLKEKGIPLFFPLDPSLGASIGGMIAMGCSGTNAVRYGTARGEWILNVTAVLPSGEVIKTRQRSRKSSAGFDMTKLFIGSEGTLGIITEATLRLAPRLPTRVGMVVFPDVLKASQSVREILNRGGAVQCAELLDSLIIECFNMVGNRNFQLKDTVLFKYQGTPAIIADTARLVEEVSREYGGTDFSYYDQEKEADEIWNLRKTALPQLVKRYPGYHGLVTDVCVPLSRLPELIESVKKELTDRNIVAPLAGHIGDGNFHAHILYKNEEELRLGNEVLDHMIVKALELDGTCTGEHGVGLSKRRYLAQELGEGTVALLCTIKRTMDPDNLFNPGKLYPAVGDHIPNVLLPENLN